MANTMTLTEIDQLPSTTASDVKKEGWRKLTRRVQAAGSVAVTSHGEVEVVILSRDLYITMLGELRERQKGKAADLEALRRRFDERLASLAAPDAGDRLRSSMAAPATLGGSVKAGTGF